MNTITDDQIAEIEALANDAAPFDWGPDIGMTHAETVYACSVGPDSILALIARLREAERDAARYRWVREKASGAPEDFEVVACAAFAAAYGCDYNFDLNIDEAMQEAKQ